jgi:hypothetical protein
MRPYVIQLGWEAGVFHIARLCQSENLQIQTSNSPIALGVLHFA